MDLAAELLNDCGQPWLPAPKSGPPARSAALPILDFQSEHLARFVAC